MPRGSRAAPGSRSAAIPRVEEASRIGAGDPPRPWAVAAWTAAAAIPLAFLCLFFLWPVASLVATGFTADGRFDASGIAEVFGQARSWRVIGQTLAQAALATAVSLALGLPAAYALYRLDFPGRTLLRGLLTVPFVLPTVVVGVAFTALLGPGGPLAWLGLERSLAVIVAALAFFNVTVVARTVGAFWARLDRSAEQAARVLGAGRVRAWLTVVLPALAPAIASAASLVFLFASTSFGIVLILGGREFANVETEIYRLTVQFLDLRGAAVLSLAQFAIVGASLLVSARLRSAGERAVELREEADRAQRPGLADLPVLLVFAVSTLLLQVAPILALLARSLRDREGAWTLANYLALLDPPAELPLDEPVIAAVGRSLRIALLAAAIAMVLGLLLALVLSRRPAAPVLRRGLAVFDGLVMLPLGVSAVTLGFGLLLTMHRPLGIGLDLRTSAALIPIAQALVALPLVVRTLLPVLRGIEQQQRLAAASLGAGPLTVLRTIELPMLGRSAGLALGFAFAVSLGEFGATSFLVRPGEQTLPVAIAQLIGHQAPGSYGAGLAAAVVLAALAATSMLLAERLRTDGRGEF
ncbi:ABC transporter permease [Leucobacter massiliensis]|uniref:Iron ABC transporter permease n=1 Tax=Leucobacter massiliensis TaxID=1686285 RepID=A0A2S9QPK8_9MICO|nr:iron ABC transporter permease [Leucobacter massiliensis]PRI11515.1 iron ABC transporter permease [Leucobacter massiliensis]